MAVGRISGPLLKANLERNGIDLAVETSLLYIDVNNGRIGINTTTPHCDLDVNGTICSERIDTNFLTVASNYNLGNVNITSTVGNLELQPATEFDRTVIQGDLEVTGSIIGYQDGFTIADDGSTTAFVGLNTTLRLSDGDDMSVVISTDGTHEVVTFSNTSTLDSITSRGNTTLNSISVSSIDGDLQGSVFGDDSTLLVDGVNNKIVGQLETSNPIINGTITSSDSSPITIGQSLIVSDDLTVENNLYLNNPVTLPAGTTLDGNQISIGGFDGDFYSLTNIPTTLSGYGITDAAFINGPFIGDLQGSVFADDSTLLVDGVSGTIPSTVIFGTLNNNLIGNVTGNLVGNVDGDLQGSVFGDDSTLIVDGINNSVIATSVTTPQIVAATTLNINTGGDFTISSPANIQMNATSGAVYIVSPITDLSGILQVSTIDSADSSAITFVPSVTFESDVDVQNDLNVTNTVTANQFIGDGSQLTGLIANFAALNDTAVDGQAANTLIRYDGAFYVPSTIIEDANGDVTISNQLTVTTGLFTPLIDTADSSALTITPSTVFSSDVTVENVLYLNNPPDFGSPVDLPSGSTLGGVAIGTTEGGGDADTLNGQPGSYYLDAANLTGNVPADFIRLGIDTVGGFVENIVGTVNEIEITGDSTTESATLTVGLPDNVTISNELTVTNGLFTPLIDTADSSAITITPSAVFSSDVTVENDLIVTNKITASVYYGDGSNLTGISTTTTYADLTDTDITGRTANSLTRFDGANYVPTQLTEDSSGNITVGGDYIEANEFIFNSVINPSRGFIYPGGAADVFYRTGGASSVNTVTFGDGGLLDHALTLNGHLETNTKIITPQIETGDSSPLTVVSATNFNSDVTVENDLNVNNDVIISGNLTVQGTTTQVDSNVVNIGDSIITLNSDEVGAPTQNAGIEVERGTSANVQFIWNESTDKWQVTEDGATYYNILTNQGNQVALGTDTTGDYIATITGTANEVEVTGSGGETAAVTIGLPDDITIGGELTVTTGLFTPLIDTTDSSALTITPSAVFSSDVTVENILYLNNPPDFGAPVDLPSGSTLGGVPIGTTEGGGDADTLNGQPGSYYLDGANFTGSLPNDYVTLGTDTTGNYVATISGTANEVEVTGSGSETAAVTIGLPNDVTIGNELTVTTGLFTPLIDTADSSALTITPAAIFSSDVTVENDLIVTNKITATEFVGVTYANLGDVDITGRTNNSLTKFDGANYVPTLLKEFSDGDLRPAKDIEMLDNQYIVLGSNRDLWLFSDGTTGIIQSPFEPLKIRVPATGTSPTADGLIIQSTTNETLASFLPNYGVHLYFDDVLRLETTPDGITVHGDVTQDGASTLSYSTLSTSTIDSLDSSAVTIVPAAVFNSDVTVENDLVVTNKVTATEYYGDGSNLTGISTTTTYAALTDTDITGRTTDSLTRFDGANYVPTAMSEDASGNVTVSGQLNVSTIDTADSSAITITPAAIFSSDVTVENDLNVNNDVIISGNLTVQGTTTQVDSNVVNIGDSIITLNSDETGTPTQNAGIEVERGTSANVQFIWNESTDTWQVTEDGATYYNLLTDAGDQVALGTDTTGDYIATITGTANEVEVTGSGGETAAVTIGLPDNVTIGGELTVTTGLFTPLIDTADSSSLTITPATTFSSDVTVENDLIVTNKITATAYYGDGSNLTGISTTTTYADLTDTDITGRTTDSLTRFDGAAYVPTAMSEDASGNVTIAGQLNIGTIDTADSSAITVTPAAVFSADVTVENDLVVTNKVTATEFIGNGSQLTNINANNITSGEIPLGTRTSGNYVATISGTANEVEVIGSGSETAAVTIGLPDNVTIGGELTVTTGLFTPLIDTADSSALTITPATTFSSDVTVENDVVVTNKITASEFIGDGVLLTNINADNITSGEIPLGTRTSGNYVATIAGTANEVEVIGSGSETAAVTIGLPDNVTIGGELTVTTGLFTPLIDTADSSALTITPATTFSSDVTVENILYLNNPPDFGAPVDLPSGSTLGGVPIGTTEGGGDADTLNLQPGSYYLDAANLTGNVPADFIRLGIDTIGGFVETIVGTANEIEITGDSTTESATLTVGLPDNVTISNELTVTTGLFTPLIDTADSSTLTITPAAVFNSDVTVENDLNVTNDVTADRFFGDGSGLYNVNGLATIVGRTEEFPTVTDGSPTVTMSLAYDIDALDVFLNGVRLRPNTDYTVSGTDLTFNENLTLNDTVAIYIFKYATKIEEFPTVVNGSADVTLGDTYSLSQLDVYLNGSKLKPTTDFTLAGTTLTFSNTLVTDDIVSVIVYSEAVIGGGQSFASLSDVDVAGQATDTLIRYNGNDYVPTATTEDASGNVTILGQLSVSAIDSADSSSIFFTPTAVFQSDVYVQNDLDVTNDVVANAFYGDGSNLTGITVDTSFVDLSDTNVIGQTTNTLIKYNGSEYVPTNLSENASGDVTVSSKLNVSLIDSADSSTINVTPAVQFQSDIIVDNDVKVTNNLNINDIQHTVANAVTYATTAASSITNFPGADFSSGNIIIQVKDNVTSQVQICKISIVHDTSTVSTTEYSNLYTGGVPLATFTGVIRGGYVHIDASGASNNSTTYKVVKTLLKFI